MEKLSEAIFKMKPGDKFGPTDYDYIIMDKTDCLHWVQNNGLGEPVILCTEHLNLEGEIIPAEPKVMNIEEILDKEGRTYECRPDFIEYGEECHQNGRLEMWLEFKKELSGGLTKDWVEKILEKLKPKD